MTLLAILVSAATAGFTGASIVAHHRGRISPATIYGAAAVGCALYLQVVAR